jgi:hypothetical protein
MAVESEVSAGDESLEWQRRFVKNEPGQGCEHCRAKAANGTVGMADEYCVISCARQHGENVIVLAVEGIATIAEIASAVTAAIHQVAGVSVGKLLRDVEPIVALLEATGHEAERRARAEARKADAGAVIGPDEVGNNFMGCMSALCDFHFSPVR